MKIQIDSGKVGRKEVISNFNLDMAPGDCIALLGRNGAGKSSLFYMLTAHKKYRYTGSVTDIPERVFLSFQKPPEIPEMSTIDMCLYLTNRYNKKCEDSETFKKTHRIVLKDLQITDDLLSGTLNKDLSGGENKRVELLLAYLMKPQLFLVDEIDTGLDLDTMIIIGKFLKKYTKRWKSTCIVVTHNMDFLQYFDLDKVVVLDKGKTVAVKPATIVDKIKTQGFIKTFKL